MILSYDLAARMLSKSKTYDAYDPEFQSAVEAAHEAIQNYCDRNFDRATYTEVLSGMGGNQLYVSHSPIDSVTALWIDSAGRFEVGTLQTDIPTRFVAEGNLITAYDTWFWRGPRTVKISYVAGYWPADDPDPLHVPKMPADLRRACAKVIKQFLDEEFTSKATSISLGAYSESFGGSEPQQQFAPDVIRILDQYRRIAI